MEWQKTITLKMENIFHNRIIAILFEILLFRQWFELFFLRQTQSIVVLTEVLMIGLWW